MENDENQKSNKKDSGKWYPGKYVGKAMRRSSASTGKSSSSQHGDDHTVASTEVGDFSYEADSPTNSFSETNPLHNEQEHEPGTLQSDKERSLKRQTTPKTKKLGKISLTIHEVRYLAIQSSKDYDFYDINSDLKIEFRGIHVSTTKSINGYVLLPIVQGLSPVGKASKVSTKWYEIYPYYERNKLGEHSRITKFRSGYPEIPGSALTKLPFPLGFVQLEFELHFNQDEVKNGFQLYFQPSPINNIVRVEEEADANESNLYLTYARMNRDIERIKNVLLKPFSCIAPFLSFPEVFPLISVFFFFCHSLSYQQVPFACFFIVLLNGIVALTNRNYNNVAVWNEPGVVLNFNAAGAIQMKEDENTSRVSVASYASPSYAAVVGILKNSQTLQARLHNAAHWLEVFANIFTFADPRASIMFYGAYFAATVLLTMFLFFFSAATVIASLGSMYFLVLAADEFAEEQIAGLSKKSVYLKYVSLYRSYYSAVYCFLSKVPDQLELNHRHICGRQVVKEGGAEMLDAAEFYEKKEK